MHDSNRSRLTISTLRGEGGFTLTELMIALMLGLLVMLAATVMLLSARSTYRTQDQGTRLEEGARFALDLVSRVVRMGGFTNFGSGTTELPSFYASGVLSPSVSGINDCASATSTVCKDPGSNHSDQLAVSFYGSDAQTLPRTPDRAVLDCKGDAIGAIDPTTSQPLPRSTNVFFVKIASDGEPELMCDDGDPAGPQALIRGVETFQVLYGIPLYEGAVYPAGTPPPARTTDDREPVAYTYKRADQIVTTALGINQWDYVRSIRIAMSIRSEPGARPDLDNTIYQLFGANYATAAADAGAELSTAGLSNLDRSRLRRVVTSTITIRNRLAPWPNSGP